MISFRPHRPARLIAIAIGAGASITCAAPALAHDIVIFPEWNDGVVQVDIKYGHPADYHPIVQDKLYAFSAFEPSAGEASWRKELVMSGDDLKLSQKPSWNPDAGVLLLAGQYDNGYWSRDAGGDYVNTSRLTYPNTKTASHNLKYAKALLATGPSHVGFDRVVGQKLEVVPLADPFGMKVGDRLPVMIRFNGKPLVGAGVEIGDSVTGMPEDQIPRYKTDAKGVAMVPIGKPGWEVVGVDFEEKSPLQKLTDQEKYTATLVFRLP